MRTAVRDVDTKRNSTSVDEPQGNANPSHRLHSTETAQPVWNSMALSPPAPFSVQRVLRPGAGTDYAPIVDDDADSLQPGQLRKSDFLDQTERAVCEAVNSVLRPGGQSTDGCPYLIALFPRLRRRNAAALNAIVSRYGGAMAAGDLLALIVNRARQSAETWLATGELKDVPELSEGAGDRQMGGEFLQAKTVDGAAMPSPDNPGAVRSALGGGSAFDGAVRGRMESAFGESFSDVRIHQDSRADSLANRYGALAFTVGNHVAFSRGSFAPGTPAGDALLAHELAHVRQQRGAKSDARRSSGYQSPGFEREADGVAARVLGRVYGNSESGLPARTAGGLALQRCKGKSKPAPIRKDQRPLSQGTMMWTFAPHEDRPELLTAKIEFMPNDALKKSARSISFIQTLTATDQGGAPDLNDRGGGKAFAGPNNVRVDFIAADDDQPLYGTAWIPSKPDEPAVLTDIPMTSFRKEFETVALIVETGQVLGSFHWGVDYGNAGSGGVGSPLIFGNQADCKDAASPEFQPAVDRFFANRYEETLEGFGQNSADLSEDHRKALDRIAGVLRGNPSKIALLGASADLSEIQPEQIARRRADAIIEYLMKAGIDRSRTRTHVFGSEWARVPTSIGASEPANRRVLIALADKGEKDSYQLNLPKRGQ